MTKYEMLLKLINKSGWTVTEAVDEDGARIAVATDKDAE